MQEWLNCCRSTDERNSEVDYHKVREYRGCYETDCAGVHGKEKLYFVYERLEISLLVIQTYTVLERGNPYF